MVCPGHSILGTSRLDLGSSNLRAPSMPSCILHPSQEATKNGACKNRQDRDTSQQPSPLLDPGVCAVRIPSCECTVGSLAPVPVSCSPLHPAALFLGSRNCLPQRGVSHAHPHLRSRSPALSWGADGPGWDEHRPLPSSAALLLRKHLPFPRWAVGLFQEQRGPSMDSWPPCSPTSGVFSTPPPTCFFVSPSALPPPPDFLPLSKWKSQLRLCF